MRRLRRVLSLAESPIGRDVPVSVALVMAAIALAMPVVDLVLLERLPYDAGYLRAVPACGAAGLFALLVRGRFEAVGCRFDALPSWRYWLKATLTLAALFAVILLVAFVIYLAADIEVKLYPPTSASELFSSLVEAPLLEESVYRWVMVTGIAALAAAVPRALAQWLAIAISGVAFGYLHFVYDAAAANNIAAGFVFAWMYLRSGSILVPIAFHSLGNAAVAAINVVAYHLLV